jgi:hypothetical protein
VTVTDEAVWRADSFIVALNKLHRRLLKSYRIKMSKLLESMSNIILYQYVGDHPLQGEKIFGWGIIELTLPTTLRDPHSMTQI